MLSTDRKPPIASYAVILLCALIFAAVQGAKVDSLQKQRTAAMEAAFALDPFAGIAEGSEAERLTSEYSQAAIGARAGFKLVFLLVIVFPCSVIFPALLATADSDEEDVEAPKVVRASTMTRDQVNLGVPKSQTIEIDEQLKVIFFTGGVFLASSAALGLFWLWMPDVYGGWRTWALFACGALIVFSANGIVERLKNNLVTPGRIALALGVGYAALAGLAWTKF